MTKEKIVMCWSGGKDSALALHELRKSDQYEVVALVTTCTEELNRISMHGVRCELLEAQAQSVGLPLVKTMIPKLASNRDYEARMHATFCEFKKQGISTIAFGDLFLEDIRTYRNQMLEEVGMQAIYPVWGKDTTLLARDFIKDGFNAVLVCIDPRVLKPSFAGRNFDETLLRDLPKGADPCGENGEFHTFVFQGPILKQPIPFRKREVMMRDGFYFCDLVAASSE